MPNAVNLDAKNCSLLNCTGCHLLLAPFNIGVHSHMHAICEMMECGSNTMLLKLQRTPLAVRAFENTAS